MRLKEWKGAQDNVFEFISHRFICYVIDFVTERQIALTRLFMCYTQNIISRINIGNTGKVSICGKASYIFGLVFREIH